MTRISGSAGFKGEDDVLYAAELKEASIVKSDNPQYPEDRLKVVWRTEDGREAMDRMGLKLGLAAATKEPSRLRQMLNALAEKPKDTELWFDPATREWGYDLDGEDTTPAYAKLAAGMALMFRGSNQANGSGTFYKITAYRAVKAKK